MRRPRFGHLDLWWQWYGVRGLTPVLIEYTQRDLNIALMKELAIIFDKVGIGCCARPAAT